MLLGVNAQSSSYKQKASNSGSRHLASMLLLQMFPLHVPEANLKVQCCQVYPPRTCFASKQAADSTHPFDSHGSQHGLAHVIVIQPLHVVVLQAQLAAHLGSEHHKEVFRHEVEREDMATVRWGGREGGEGRGQPTLVDVASRGILMPL
jgi:hypothetical protein